MCVAYPMESHDACIREGMKNATHHIIYEFYFMELAPKGQVG